MNMKMTGPRVFVACAFFIASILAAQRGPTVPATATFTNIEPTYTNMIRSDAVSPTYQNAVDCVTSEVFSNGLYVLRTDYLNCTATSPRTLVLDFSQCVAGFCPSNFGFSSCSLPDPNFPSDSLNVCGPNNVKDTRLLASTLFQSLSASSLTTAVSLPFSLETRFTGSSSFELDFEQPVPFQAVGSAERILTAGQGAIADLYELVPKGSTVQKKEIGRYSMPFDVTVTK